MDKELDELHEALESFYLEMERIYPKVLPTLKAEWDAAKDAGVSHRKMNGRAKAYISLSLLGSTVRGLLRGIAEE